MKNIIIFGNSGSGKTTIANYLVENYNFIHIHPIGDLKIFLQEYFDCPSLDTKEGKEYCIKNITEDFTINFLSFLQNKKKLSHLQVWGIIKNINYFFSPNFTLGEFMINLYHFCEKENFIKGNIY